MIWTKGFIVCLAEVDSPPSYNNVEMSAEQKYSTPHGYPSQDARFVNASQSVSLAYYPSVPVQHPVIVLMQPVGTLPYQPPSDNSLGLAICSMFCCFFIGIFALLKAINSRDLYRCGNYAEAKRSGQLAIKIAIAAILVGFIIVAYFIIRILAASEFGGQRQG